MNDKDLGDPDNVKHSYVNLEREEERIVYLNDAEKNEGYTDNKVITSKYTRVNFIPKFLAERLSQVGNR